MTGTPLLNVSVRGQCQGQGVCAQNTAPENSHCFAIFVTAEAQARSHDFGIMLLSDLEFGPVLGEGFFG